MDGEILKLIRDKKTYSLEYVADEIGISSDELTEIETQAQAPDIEILTKLSDLYQTPISIIKQLSIDHNTNGDKDEQRRQELKSDIAYHLFIEGKYPLRTLSDNLRELRQLKTKREGLKVHESS